MWCDTQFKNEIFGSFVKLALLFSIGWLVACDGSQKQSVEPVSDIPLVKNAQSTEQVHEVLEKYLSASVARDYSACYDLLSEKDRAAVSRQTFIDGKQSGSATLADAYYEKITHQTGDIVIDKNRATAMVEYRFPDVEYMIKNLFGLSILSDFTDNEIMQMKKELEQAYQDRPLPMKRRNKTFQLHREPAGWRIYLGLDRSDGAAVSS